MRYLWNRAEEDLEERFLSLLERTPGGVLLDLGCDTGDFTIKIAARVEAEKVLGIELVRERYLKAQDKGITVFENDLNKRFPVDDQSVDVVTANQVIEHLVNIDTFIEEIHRVLKPNGYAIIATENLASTHNIFALLLGYQPFVLTNISKKGSIGNPLAMHYSPRGGWDLDFKLPYAHNRVLTFKALLDLVQRYGFKVDARRSFGYHPFPHSIARILSRVDPYHAHFLVVKLRKHSLNNSLSKTEIKKVALKKK